MEHAHAPRSHGAPTAIAAVLALASTPALAQDATVTDLPGAPVQAAPAAPASSAVAVPPVEPATVEAVPAQPTPAQPTVVLPEIGNVSSAPSAVQPVEAPQAETVTAPTRPARSVSPARKTNVATAVTRSAPEPTRVPTADNTGTAQDGTLARGDAPSSVVAAPVSPPAPARAAPAAQPAAAENSDRLPIEGIAGLLAALGVAGAGIALMWMRRRNPDAAEPDYVEADQAFAYQPLEPAAELRPAEASVPLAMAPAARIPFAEERASGPVPLGDDRQALLDAMVAAPPNAANPFTSHKARMRRARLILQHREHLQTQGKPFDWRTYRPTTKPAVPSAAEQKETVEV